MDPSPGRIVFEVSGLMLGVKEAAKGSARKGTAKRRGKGGRIVMVLRGVTEYITQVLAG